MTGRTLAAGSGRKKQTAHDFDHRGPWECLLLATFHPPAQDDFDTYIDNSRSYKPWT